MYFWNLCGLPNIYKSWSTHHTHHTQSIYKSQSTDNPQNYRDRKISIQVEYETTDGVIEMNRRIPKRDIECSKNKDDIYMNCV